jgi:hypothetical protein
MGDLLRPSLPPICAAMGRSLGVEEVDTCCEPLALGGL